ncbi:MAG: alcohol dehydrogenase catalytic domain-containing protein, partial [Burkholderiales bacterium]|nr:alcohol dehydrogenase catalytic domain-containing protein [Burkholderiales bacterium]
ALSWDTIEVSEPGPGEARISQTAVGLNYIDIYHRTGLYKLPSLPAIIGMEGAGVIRALGDGVSDFNVGDRVAYAGVLGAYAVER